MIVGPNTSRAVGVHRIIVATEVATIANMLTFLILTSLPLLRVGRLSLREGLEHTNHLAHLMSGYIVRRILPLIGRISL